MTSEILTALILVAAAPARAAEGTPADSSILATHGSPTGAMMPQPTLPPAPSKTEPQPWPLRLLVHPMKDDKGMWIRLPMIDTDPNRGITIGFLPIWIFNSVKENRILQMHAPSITYNKTFKTNLTYRYYYYPDKDSTLMARAAYSQVLEKEAFLQYDDSNLFGMFGETGLKMQYNVDASNRFFGFGPNTRKDASSNYVINTMIVDGYFGLPFVKGSNWYWTVEDRLSGNKIADGPVKSIPGITALYPAATPNHYHQSNTYRAYLTYDTLDNSVTTTKGSYCEFFAETSQRHWSSEYTFQHYSVDLRHFFHNSDDDTFVTAVRYKFEDVVGNGVPLWLQPSLGGKYTLPAYGDGRFTTAGLMVGMIEERMIMFRLKTGGVLTKYELAPFAGLGSAFDTPGQAQMRYARPVFGLGLRAIAPPQVVGSIDFGVGQEGMAAFMDINYPF